MNNQPLKPENFSILIVEDDKSSREFLSNRRKNEGYMISQAIDGIEATELLGFERFDIILLDLNMPRMGGFEFLEWLNENCPENSMHIITLSGESNRDAVVTALTLGASDYIIKSASIVELLNRIQRLCLTRYLQDKKMKGFDISSIKAAKIITVDDEELNLKLVRKYLIKVGYSVECFSDGASMLETIKQQMTDLLLLDIQMPDMNGVEVLKESRKLYAPEELAIIMLSGVNDTKLIDECYQLGADDYIIKPFSRIELISRINAALELKALRSHNKKLEDLTVLGHQLRPH